MSGEKRPNSLKKGNKLLAIFFLTIGLLLLFVFLLWSKFSDVIEYYQISYIEDAQGELITLLETDNDTLVDDLEAFSDKYRVELLVQEKNTIIYTSNSITSIEQQEAIYDEDYVYKTLFYEDNYTVWMSMINIDINDIINYYLLATIIVTVVITLMSLGLIFYFFKSFTKPFIAIMNLIGGLKQSEDDKTVTISDLDVISNELIGLHNKIALVEYNYDSMSTIYESEKSSNKEIIDEQMKYLSTVLHDLKTPLSSIDISRFNLQNDFANDPNAMESINNIKTQTERTLKLIVETLNNVIDDSESIYFDSSEVFVKEEILKYLSNSRVLIETKNIEFDVNIDDIVIIVNKLKYSQILTNIVANIIEYSKPNTTIKIYSRQETIIFENYIGKEKSEISTLYGMKRVEELCSELEIGLRSGVQGELYITEMDLEDVYG